ncbi:MAG: acyl-CoA desaturase [Bacteroidota bacterium]
MTYRPVSFPVKDRPEFWRTLRKNVNQYFDDNNISPYGDRRMYFKTLIMLSIYLVPLGLMLAGVVTNGWLVMLCWFIMGLGAAGIGMGVMHDANHGAYSSDANTNRLVGYVLNILGGLAINWKIQHNKQHHSYTNIHHHDGDISPGFFLRFSPHSKWYPFHRFQHIYAWFLYGLQTLAWATIKDFKKMTEYYKKGLMGKEGKKIYKWIGILVVQKVFYFSIFLVAPIMLTDIPVYQIILGWLLMHFTAGLILSAIFQLAHVMPMAEYPLPDESLSMRDSWAIHQLQTTTNFAPGKGLFGWFMGGLNHQVEHHLFPRICHVHYPEIAKIVSQTAKDFNIPWHSIPTFGEALVQHVKMLHYLGQNPATNPQLKV